MASSLINLLCCRDSTTNYTSLNEKTTAKILNERSGYQKTKPMSVDDTDMLAHNAILALINGDEQPLKSINAQFSRDAARTASWAEGLAESILNHLAEAIKPGSPIGDALRETYERVRDAALVSFGWAKDHPLFASVIVVVIALGILCLITPWVVHVLGFTADGVAAGSWAARWQSLCDGVIEKDSFFAWLQSFGALH